MALTNIQKPALVSGRVMHQRLAPKKNGFSYPIYYLGLPLDQLDELASSKSLALNRFAPTSFYTKDHGARIEQSDLKEWAFAQLETFGLADKVSSITLITMPRIFGFVFNPVSFWLCLDTDNQLRAMIYEVNNTFGETHSYICGHENAAVINPNEWITARKEFHVSPFLPREGHYRFRVSLEEDKLGIWINYYNAKGERTLNTALNGTIERLNGRTVNKALWQNPFITLQTLSLIHWQAIKLKLKGLQFFSLPKQKTQRVSRSEKFTNL